MSAGGGRAAVVECVPNFSEGRDAARIGEVAAAAAAHALLLDVSSDGDHNRSVITLCGAPGAVVDAAVAAADAAARLLTLEGHGGVHPRVGVADVVPFVPLCGSDLEACTELAFEAGRRIAAEAGIAVYFYGAAAGGRRLADIRAGRFRPDLEGSPARASAGAACVGARPLLVAYNVLLEGATPAAARALAAGLRASAPGGVPGLQTLVFELPGGRVQLSMNVVEVVPGCLDAVRSEIGRRCAAAGIGMGADEVVGLCPQEAAGPAASGRLLETRMVAAALRRAAAESGRRPGEEPRALAGALAREAERMAAAPHRPALDLAEAAAAAPRILARGGLLDGEAAAVLGCAAARLRGAVPDEEVAAFPERVRLLDAWAG